MKNLGFDYVEIPLYPTLNAPQAELEDFMALLEKNKLKCEAVNVLFGGGIKLTGKNADFSKINEYLDMIFEKTNKLQYEIVVFGSGGARKFEDPFTYEEAAEQIIYICDNILAKYANKYDFVVAVEELNRNETNFANTISQTEDIVLKCSEKIKVLADFYHMALEKDSLKNMKDLKQVVHCHTANPVGRHYNTKHDEISKNGEFAEFFSLLSSSGYNARMSIEGSLRENSITGFTNESKECLTFLKELCEQF